MNSVKDRISLRHMLALVQRGWQHFIISHPIYKDRDVGAERLQQDLEIFQNAFAYGYCAAAKQLPKEHVLFPRELITRAIGHLQAGSDDQVLLAIDLRRALEEPVQIPERKETMSAARFNDLLKGPLSHPLLMFSLSRMAIALKDVVDECGAAGVEALERHCREREEDDQRKAEA